PLPLTFYKQDTVFCIFDEEHTFKFRWDYGQVKKILIDRDKAVWIASEEGLFRIISFEFLNFTGETGVESNIWSVVEDREHNIWFASLNKSLQRWDGENIDNIESFKEVNNRGFFTGSICLPDGRILFTQSTGVTQYSDGTFSAVPYAGDQCEKIYYNEPDSTLFIALVNKGLVIKKGDELKTIRSLTAWGHGWITDIAYDPEGFYWLVTSKTIARLYNDSLYVYPIEKSPVNNGYVVEVDSLGNAWFGGLEGLFMYDRPEDRFINASIEGPMIAVNGIALMENNRILAGRMNDIVIIDIEKFREGSDDFYFRYDASSGFLGYEVQQDGIMRDHAGNYWINCIDRVVKFMPDTDPPAAPPPLLNLFSIEVMDQSPDWQELYTVEQVINRFPDPVVLGPGQTSVRMDYRAVSGHSPGKTVYSFRVPSFYDEWTKPDPDSELMLNGLKPGKYIIEARAAGQKSGWSELLSLELIIKPTLWQTAVFNIFLAAVILLSGVLAGIWLTRRSNERKKRKVRAIKDYYRLQMGSFVQQFDPHFTFNVLSSLVSFIELGDKERANRYLFKFSDLLRMALRDNSFVRTLADEIDFISGYCELQKIQMEEKLQFNTDIRSPGTLSVNIPRMMVHNFVENAIKWGLKPSVTGGRVDIIIDCKDGYHIITVEDNGIGRVAAQKKEITGHGIGLDVSMKLINMLNKINREEMQLIIEDLYDNDGKAAGTRVILKIPERFNMLEEE
ncbi:MAG: histidine kinase, partial [Bacteroidales bacterium]